ncbi:PIN domain-containing protein [Vibrio rhizosphaerae]|uniref:PIN domain-containing protein n=1 Tax=Vibrio rhizosphaerae TaxID=398736 RepID=UPI0005701A16
MGDTDRKRFVLDTNIRHYEPLVIDSFQQHDVVFPMTALKQPDPIQQLTRYRQESRAPNLGLESSASKKTKFSHHTDMKSSGLVLG